jgi:SAM-dependent methyltransferase
MSEVQGGIRAMLAHPPVFRLFKRLVLGPSALPTIVEKYIVARPHDKVLDIGCGLGDVVGFLPPVDYTGFDMSPAYIAAAKERYGDRGRFYCEKVDAARCEAGVYDLVLAIGVLHHLDDGEALDLCRLAAHALKVGGRLVTVDCGYLPRQSKMARFIISRDRGQNVRTDEGYRQLATQVFSQVAVDIRHDLLRIPYTHVILRCTKD